MKFNLRVKSSFLTASILIFTSMCLVHVTFAFSSMDWLSFQNNEENTGYSITTSPTTNERMWLKYLGGAPIVSSPAVANGVVYIGSYTHKIYALNAAKGNLIWEYITGNNVLSSPAVKNDVVYVGSNDCKMYALKAATGVQIWNYTTKGSVSSSPAVANGVVYLGSSDHKVYALNASTGVHIWNYTTGDYVLSSPAVANGVVYVGSYDDNVYALNASTGVHIWNYTTGASVFSSPAVANDILYIGSYDKKVHAINATTGVHIWNYTTGGSVQSSPAIANGVVYVGSYDQKVYALNAVTGVHIWNYTTGGSVQSSLAVANEIVYTASSDNLLYAINATTGRHIWKYAITAVFSQSPAVANGAVYIGSPSGVFAFGQPSYKISFVESGLRSGTNWSVTLDGVTKSLTAKTINFIVPNGEYNFSINAPSGYNSSSDLSGTIVVYYLDNITNIEFTKESAPSNDPINYNLSIYVTGNGTVNPGNQTHIAGTCVNLEASASEGWTFTGWSGDATGTENSSIVIDSDKTIYATFTDDAIPEFPSVLLLAICIMSLTTACIMFNNKIKPRS